MKEPHGSAALRFPPYELGFILLLQQVFNQKSNYICSVTDTVPQSGQLMEEKQHKSTQAPTGGNSKPTAVSISRRRKRLMNGRSLAQVSTGPPLL